MDRDDDFLHKLDLIFAYIKELLKVQQEIFAFMQSLDERLPVLEKIPVRKPVSKPKRWLDAYEVKELLQVGDLTLRRRRQEGAFVAKKIGKKWFYLRSSPQ